MHTFEGISESCFCESENAHSYLVGYILIAVAFAFARTAVSIHVALSSLSTRVLCPFALSESTFATLLCSALSSSH